MRKLRTFNLSPICYLKHHLNITNTSITDSAAIVILTIDKGVEVWEETSDANKNAILESLISFKRAGASAIVTYFAEEAANKLK